MNIQRLVYTIGVSTLASMIAHSACLAQTTAIKGLTDQARVVLKKHCITCHSESQARGDLDMSSTERILAGSSSGAVIVPGKPDESLLYLLAAHQGDPKMPPNAPRISQRELGILSRWISTLPDAAGASEANGAPAKMARRDMSKVESGGTKADVGQQREPSRTESSASLQDFDVGLMPSRPLPRATAITAVATNPAFSLAAVSGLHQVLLLDLKSREWLGGLEFPEGDVFAIDFSNDGKKLFAAGGIGGLTGAVVCWELTSHRRVATIATDQDAVLALDSSPDGQLVAIGGPTRTVQVIRVADRQPVAQLKKHTDWITSLAFSPDGLLLASADRFGGLWVWEMPTGKEFTSHRGHSGPISALGWTRDSNSLLSGGRDGVLQVWDMHQTISAAKWTAHQGGVEALIAIDDRWVSAGQDKSIAVWNGTEKKAFQRSVDALLTKLAVSAGGRVALAGDVDGAIHLIPLQGEETSLRIPLPTRVEKYVAKVFRPAAVDRRTVATPKLVESTHASGSRSAEVAPSDVDSELRDTRRALELSQHALQQAYESVHALEEAVARLKQVAAVQEARLNPKRIEPKTTQGNSSR